MLGTPVGLVLMPSRQLSYASELTVAVMGPLFNVLFALLLIFIGSEYKSDVFYLLSGISIASAACNLVPISKLDGGRIIFSICAMIFELDTAERICYTVSFFACCVLIFFSLWLILFHDIGYRIFFSLLIIIVASEKNQR